MKPTTYSFYKNSRYWRVKSIEKYRKREKRKFQVFFFSQQGIMFLFLFTPVFPVCSIYSLVFLGFLRFSWFVSFFLYRCLRNQHSKLLIIIFDIVLSISYRNYNNNYNIFFFKVSLFDVANCLSYLMFPAQHSIICGHQGEEPTSQTDQQFLRYYNSAKQQTK